MVALTKFLFLLLVAPCAFAQVQKTEMAMIKGGEYTPLFDAENGDVSVESFYLDVHPVTNLQFLAFVKENIEWRRSNVSKLFADKNYLADWKSDVELGENSVPDAPVTMISWFAARAYADWVGKRLPTIDEWEYVAMASKTKKDARTDSLFSKKILSWYERPNTYILPIKQDEPNLYGVYDLYGLVWEWAEDFNSVLITGESRNDRGGNNTLFCGGGAIGATDLMDYAAFMRFAFRGSLKPHYSIKNLGFRCAKDFAEKTP